MKIMQQHRNNNEGFFSVSREEYKVDNTHLFVHMDVHTYVYVFTPVYDCIFFAFTLLFYLIFI